MREGTSERQQDRDRQPYNYVYGALKALSCQSASIKLFFHFLLALIRENCLPKYQLTEHQQTNKSANNL